MQTVIDDRNSEFSKSVERFVRHCKGQQMASNTLDSYGYVLGGLGGFLARLGRVDIESIGIDDLEDYLHFIQFEAEKPVVATTAAHTHTVIKGWLDWLEAKGQCPLESRDMAYYRTLRPKARRKKPEVNWNGLIKLVNELASDGPPANLTTRQELQLWWRRHAIYALLFSSAMRVSELCSVNRRVIDQNEHTITIVGKGDKARQVLISPVAMMFCKGYLAQRSDHESALFIAHDDEAEAHKRIDHRLRPRTIQIMVKHDGEYNGVAGMTPHKLRHLAAKVYMEQTGDLESLRLYLGHASITTTSMYYANMEENHMLAKIQTYHPAFRSQQRR